MAERYPKYEQGLEGPQLPFRTSLMLEGYAPENATKFGRVAAGLDAKGYDTYIGPGAGKRTREDAAANAARGTGSRNSKHIQALAIDLRDKAIRWSKEDPEKARAYAEALGQLAEENDLDWGGNWFKKGGKEAEFMPGIGWDPHHIEVRSSSRARQLFQGGSAEKKAVELGAPVVQQELSTVMKGRNFLNNAPENALSPPVTEGEETWA